MNYDKTLYIEMAIQLLEGDINYVATHRYIPGYELDDLKQELRLQLFKKLPKYDCHRAGFRAWANIVMKNRITDLLRKHSWERDVILLGSLESLLPSEDNIETIYDICKEKDLNFSDFV